MDDARGGRREARLQLPLCQLGRLGRRVGREGRHRYGGAVDGGHLRLAHAHALLADGAPRLAAAHVRKDVALLQLRLLVALVLAAQRAMRGPFPARMLACPLAPMFLTTAGVPYEVDPKGAPKGVYFVESLPDSSLRAVLTRQMVLGQEAFGASHVDRCISFVESLLTLDPEERPTAAAALRHPFFEHLANAQCADPGSSSFTSVIDAASGLHATSVLDAASGLDARVRH